MGKNNQLNEERHKFALNRVFGSAPWMKTSDKQRHKTKIFKSGNSLALRIPAGTDLVVGMEMELIIEHCRTSPLFSLNENSTLPKLLDQRPASS
jgi:antitoxin VapB